MITPEDILKAVNKVLKEAFPQIPRESQDIKEGFDRECFFVELAGISESYITEAMTNDRTTVRIHYFPKDMHVNRAELYGIRDRMRNALGLAIRVKEDIYVSVNDLEYEITENGVLMTDFQVEYAQFVPEEEDLEDMDNLVYAE